ncbi:glycoside hydrolase family 57 [Chloroherpeton thalassium ATCC 35110]|uniref:Glycoside hydrolase family 57 n=1 Tax=Chloroherpeton thalassium (strain ATCC 35110 / GB-78) TaxID=517418 RepID=B3QXD1_CHLT3|nr:DUF3536 domain-containing protein [Chloroherpeton thalassium]ACF13405.1 glycoside hydrolase family 57 [Chloroherpeton thalassium ATCC 35110]
MNRNICIHGHFYQPPRENPWLEEIELQDSAYPFKNWNERITAECYAPNTASRIFDHDRIVKIANNYSKMSFNFGPTLLSWLARRQPEVYQAILFADKESRKHFSGHGAAIAQVYNHIIMPLANEHDKHTQVIWGIRDFEHRFKRRPEGMWLAETAVDTASLEALAAQGIKYTILAPRQAKRVRRIGEAHWHDVIGERVDSRRAYLCHLPSGATISLFFYDGMISQDLAFGGLVHSGENLARRLVAVFDADEDNHAMIGHVATDGETYGHHQRYADRALAYCMYFVEENNLANITIYGEFLDKHPPTYEVEIVENSSWSCYHGVERWRQNCGCNTGRPGWNQLWREPLRNALDWLRDELARIYESEIGNYGLDAWYLRNEYIDVVLDRSEKNVERFLSEKFQTTLTSEEKTKILQLLEMQRNALLMYTSCGWFFDEISGIETIQIMQYAARAMQLAEEVAGENFEAHFLSILEQAPSNIPELQNGAKIYERVVKPAVVDLLRVGAHYAVSSLFEEYPEETEIYSYTAVSDLQMREEKKGRKLAVGRARFHSHITLEERAITYVAFHLGDQNLDAGIREFVPDESFDALRKELSLAFHHNETEKVISLITQYFGEHRYSLKHLFRDEKRKVFDQILKKPLSEIESYFREVYDNQYSLLTAMKAMQAGLPKPLKHAAEYTLNSDVRRLLEAEPLNVPALEEAIRQVNLLSLDLENHPLGLAATKTLNKAMDRFSRSPEDIELLKLVQREVDVLSRLKVELDFWHAQNVLYRIAQQLHDNKRVDADSGDENAQAWMMCFNKISASLRVKV